MRCDPYQVVRNFEAAVAEYTGAKYCVAVSSCTMALLLAVKWFLYGRYGRDGVMLRPGGLGDELPYIEIPKRTYISVPMSIIHAGGWPVFSDQEWLGYYQLRPLEVYDSARWFYRGMYNRGRFQCVSFHWTKTLAIGQGGAILHDNDEADEWFRRARFDGRKEGVSPKDDTFTMIGHHCYLSPRDAAEGLSRLAVLPEYNAPLPNSNYPDLSRMEIFK